MSKYQQHHSKYCYPGTEVLINKLNIQDLSKLEKAERIFTLKRLAELHHKPIPGDFNLKHLKEIHKHLFQDIYPFNGQIRNEQISKGATTFASPLHIESYSKELFKELKSEKQLKHLDVEQFSERAAHYMSEINILHPFREGNGRTQREFIRTLAMKNGYELDWSRVDTKTLLDASIKSVRDPKDLGEVIKDSIVNQQPERVIIEIFEERTLSR
ncbi:Fic/DOC family protein [Cytobacillus sp. FJAT-54145]|uniref:protein adenylyltransferase n=1 Tax=Cytobacillus spartinae TaxID=3299023 RepID=A0ABW6KI06_9BACI